MSRFKRKTVEELLRTPGAERAFEEEVLLGRVTAKIAQLLAKQDFKQQDLAEKLGVSRGRVSQCLSGAENMTLKTLAGIGQALGYRFDLIADPIGRADHLAESEEAPAPMLYRPMPEGLCKPAEPRREFSARIKQTA